MHFSWVFLHSFAIWMVLNISLIKMMPIDWWTMFIVWVELFCNLLIFIDVANISFNKSRLSVHFWVPFLNNVAINGIYRWDYIDYHSHAGPFYWNIDYLDWDRHYCQKLILDWRCAQRILDLKIYFNLMPTVILSRVVNLIILSNNVSNLGCYLSSCYLFGLYLKIHSFMSAMMQYW